MRPGPLRPSFTSTYAAFMMRIGSKPLCWKKRLSSAEVTACTSTGGMSWNLTMRRFSRLGPERLVMSCGSSWYCGARRIVLQRDDLRDLAVGELDDARLLVEVGVAAREDLDRVRLELVVSHRIAARFGVAAAPQLGGDLGGRNGVAHRHRSGAAKILADWRTVRPSASRR